MSNVDADAGELLRPIGAMKWNLWPPGHGRSRWRRVGNAGGTVEHGEQRAQVEALEAGGPRMY
jgi:hypothetical protein